MSCNFDRSRPCDTSNRKANRYTRADVDRLALACQLAGYSKKMTMDAICDLLKAQPANSMPSMPSLPPRAEQKQNKQPFVDLSLLAPQVEQKQNKQPFVDLSLLALSPPPRSEQKQSRRGLVDLNSLASSPPSRVEQKQNKQPFVDPDLLFLSSSNSASSSASSSSSARMTKRERKQYQDWCKMEQVKEILKSEIEKDPNFVNNQIQAILRYILISEENMPLAYALFGCFADALTPQQMVAWVNTKAFPDMKVDSQGNLVLMDVEGNEYSEDWSVFRELEWGVLDIPSRQNILSTMPRLDKGQLDKLVDYLATPPRASICDFFAYYMVV